MPAPTVVQALAHLNCAGVAAGWGHTVAWTQGGELWAWGLNDQGQLGTGSYESVPRVRWAARRVVAGLYKGGA